MALFPIVVAGVQIGLIDSQDRFSKDPGPNVFPQAVPTLTLPTPQAKVVNFSCMAGPNTLAAINVPG